MNEETRKALELARETLQSIGDVFCPQNVYNWLLEEGILSERNEAVSAIDAALSAPAAPVAVFDENLGRPKLLAGAPMLKHGDKLYLDAPAAPVATDLCERICAAIKAADDKSVEEAGYMLDSNDCIKIVHDAFAVAPAAPVAQPIDDLPTAAMTDAFARLFNVKQQRETFGPAVRAMLAAAPAAPVAQPVSEPSDAEIEAALKKLDEGPTGVNGWGYLDFARAVLALRPVAPRAPLTVEQIDAVVEYAHRSLRRYKSGARGQQITQFDGIEAHVVRATERAHRIDQEGANK